MDNFETRNDIIQQTFVCIVLRKTMISTTYRWKMEVYKIRIGTIHINKMSRKHFYPKTNFVKILKEII